MNDAEKQLTCDPQAHGLPSVGLDDPRTLAAMEEYLAELESGRQPDRKAFLARYPELADVLASCLDGLDFVRQTAPTLAADQAPAAADSISPEPPARSLGDFHIRRELGRGGMGIVYEAVQVSLGRRVALKVLPFAAALDSRQLQRFKNEAQAAALLHHTNIVPVFGVGCECGVHYYAMQFIEGQTLAQVIEELRRGSKIEDRGSKIEDRRSKADTIADRKADADTRQQPLRSSILHPRSSIFRTTALLGIQAAEALEHAHELGIIHRDIKPANILLEAHGSQSVGLGNVKITDFGLARSQGETGLTMTGDVLGTLRYMSPEQALAKRGLVDHRTDIYALGATLYELLTREPVFPGHDRQELLRQIAFDEALPLRSHDRAIPRELETIVLKALAKDPQDRYATAQEMADDLRRFLDDRPILARRPSLRERAVRWSRRHKPVLVSAVGGLVLAVIALAISTVMISQEQARTQIALQNAIQAGDQERQARLREAEALRKETEARLRETEVRQRAEENFRQARQVVDYLSQIAADDLKDMPELHELRKKILKTALKYYEALIQQSRDDDALREELVASSVQVADILSKMGNKPQAFVMYEVARLTAENVVLKKPTAAGFKQLYSIWDRQGSARLGLLSSGEVQQDVGLSAVQRRQITELTARRTRLLEEAIRQPDAGRYDKLASLADEEEKELDRVLTAEQARRLSQLVLQQRGVDGFRDPKVIAALQLTTDQEARINSILADTRRPWTAKTQRVVSEIEHMPSAHEQLLAVLTPEQKAKWQELAGKPSPVSVIVADIDVIFPTPGLGAGLESPGPILTNQLGLGRGQGLLVASIQPDSAAARAGLLVHDILWELDGKAVPGEPAEFSKLLGDIKPNTPVDAVVVRKGQKTTLHGLCVPPRDPSKFRLVVPGPAGSR